MKSIALGTVALILFGVSAARADNLRIVSATNDLAAIARAVGGDFVEVEVVARPDRDPHTLEVRPSTMRKTAKANLYLSVGLSLDLWSADIVRGSRNRNLVVVDCSQAITPLEIPVGRVDASMGDVHPQGNPHYWLDPMNGSALARFLAETFSTVDSLRAETYKQNAESFSAAIDARFPEWEKRLRGQSFVEFHRTWVYLAKRFEMTIAGQVEPLPGIPPTGRHLASLSRIITRTGVPVVVREPFHNESPLEFLRRETGVRVAVLWSSCEQPTPESYFAHFDNIVDVLGSTAPPKRGSR